MRPQRFFGFTAAVMSGLLVFNPLFLCSLKAGEETPAGLALLSDATASPAPAKAGDNVNFSVAVASLDGTPVTCNWDFGDGALAAGVCASHIYTVPGTYTAAVVASNGQGLVRSAVEVQILEDSPQAGSRSIQRASEVCRVQERQALVSARATKPLAIAPFHLLGLDLTYALDTTQPTFVKFSKGAFSAIVPVSGLSTQHVDVFVPPICAKGRFGSGTVSIVVIQGNGSQSAPSKLKVLPLPSTGSAAAGSVMLSYLQIIHDTMVSTQSAANANSYLTTNASTAISNQIASLDTLIGDLTPVVNNPKLPYPFGSSSKANLQLLKKTDQLALALMQGYLAAFSGVSLQAGARSVDDTTAVFAQFKTVIGGIFAEGANMWGEHGAAEIVTAGILLGLLGSFGAAAAGEIAVTGLVFLGIGAIYKGLQYLVQGNGIIDTGDESDALVANTELTVANSLTFSTDVDGMVSSTDSVWYCYNTSVLGNPTPTPSPPPSSSFDGSYSGSMNGTTTYSVSGDTVPVNVGLSFTISNGAVTVTGTGISGSGTVDATGAIFLNNCTDGQGTAIDISGKVSNGAASGNWTSSGGGWNGSGTWSANKQ